MHFADVLEAHWPAYVASVHGPIPSRHWRAVDAVLGCRTPRRGGHVHHCAKCRKRHYFFHSCNHRSCPRCGGRAQQEWARKQEARLLPVPYHLVTLTVPEALRPAFHWFPKEMYPLLFTQGASSLQAMFARNRWIGGQAGFTAVLHTWTRRMHLHPHLHILVPAVALAQGGCALRHPPQGPDQEFLVGVHALGRALREGFKAALAAAHPSIMATVDPSVWAQDWVVHCKQAGRGRAALRYLAAYVKKSAFSEERLLGYDAEGRVLLRWKDSGDGRWKVEAMAPTELIRRWLLHVLPRGLVRVRHYGWLGAAAHKAFLRVRFLLGMHPWRKPRPRADEARSSPCCSAELLHAGRLPPMRGPPLSRIILKR